MRAVPGLGQYKTIWSLPTYFPTSYSAGGVPRSTTRPLRRSSLDSMSKALRVLVSEKPRRLIDWKPIMSVLEHVAIVQPV